MHGATASVLDDLRARVGRLESPPARARTALPFGVRAIDEKLPGGGLTVGALHEVAGGGNGAVDGAVAALFAAGIAARTVGQLLWCVTRQDLFAAALAQAGLAADRVIYVEAGDEKALLASFEEGARHGGLGAVVAEVSCLSMTSSRRLHMAAEASGTMAIAVRRWRRQPTASMTRWRVSALPSEALPVPGVGRARWLLELIRCRGGESADFSAPLGARSRARIDRNSAASVAASRRLRIGPSKGRAAVKNRYRRRLNDGRTCAMAEISS